jgi:hypothetical protein
MQNILLSSAKRHQKDHKRYNLKKVFALVQENKHPDRIIEAIKHELRKYVKRERNKKLPEGSDFWQLDCKFGKSSDDTVTLSFADIIKELDKAREEDWKECYIEIISKATQKTSQDEEI